MREPNYHSVTHNRAAVTITTSLYDRRALDVTSDKPLVNSLNHLTYLVSSNAKVRETLSTDGGLERLVQILYECQIAPHIFCDDYSEKKLLAAWKWTLAFQCLVLIGTRGTEKIRQKLVCAGILPVIATVLDNYITLHEGNVFGASAAVFSALSQFGNHAHTQVDTAHPQSLESTSTNIATPEILSAFASATRTNGGHSFEDISPNIHPLSASQTFDSSQGINRSGLPRNQFTQEASERIPTSFLDCLTSEDYERLSVKHSFKLLCESYIDSSTRDHDFQSQKSSISNEIRRKCLILSILKKMREKKENEVIYHCDMNECEYEMDTSLQFLSNLYLQEERATQAVYNPQSKTAPRVFTNTGIVIPKDDDVVWCLQLLAYISKYPYLKDVLQSTHLLSNMSIRHKDRYLHSKENFKCRYRRQLSASKGEILKYREHSEGTYSSISSSVHPSSLNSQDDSSIEQINPSLSNSSKCNDFNLDKSNFDFSDYKLEIYADTTNCNFVSRQNYKGIGKVSNELNAQDRDVDQHFVTEVEEFFTVEALCRFEAFFKEVNDADSIVDDLNRKLALCRLCGMVDDFIEEECRNLTNTIIEKRTEQKKILSEAWNYDTYDNFDIDDIDQKGENDYDISLIEYRKMNLFPVVEKFTFLAGSDMCYWSGVIMRNSCRRNDNKGGIRQCGNLECGKWETMPREFSKCKRCKRTKYCSRDCQMRSWNCHKNWCIPSNTSASTNISESSNATYDGQRERATSTGTVTSDSATIIANTRDTTQHVPNTDQETDYLNI